ncbi:hypothetical protein MRX96_050176 [Rhipicephalus microplus]
MFAAAADEPFLCEVTRQLIRLLSLSTPELREEAGVLHSQEVDVMGAEEVDELQNTLPSGDRTSMPSISVETEMVVCLEMAAGQTFLPLAAAAVISFVILCRRGVAGFGAHRGQALD